MLCVCVLFIMLLLEKLLFHVIFFISAEQNVEILPTEYVYDNKTIYGGGEKNDLKDYCFHRCCQDNLCK